MNPYESPYSSTSTPVEAQTGETAGQTATRRAGGLVVVPPPHPAPSRLSPKDQSIIRLVNRYRQVTSGQLLRLYFNDNSPKSRRVRMCRTMKRLTKWGEVQRLTRPIGGFQGGSGGFVYVPAGSRTRIPDPHTLDITEIYCQLVQVEYKLETKLLAFDPEPYSYVELGHLELKPDAYVETRNPKGQLRCWLEVDLGTEYRAQLNAKMRRYVNGYRKWSDKTYPLILFVVPDQDRLRFIERIIKDQEMPGLFDVVLFQNAVSYLIGE